MFRGKIQSSVESLKRAEMDGYKNFLDGFTACREKNSEKEANKYKPRVVAESAENVLLGNNASNIEVNHIQHTRYKTRTSTAGTLIISEESFNNSQRRRRRRRDASIEKTNNNVALSNAGQPGTDTMKDAKGTKRSHVKHSSDPTDFKTLHDRELLKNRYDARRLHQNPTNK